MRDEPTELLTLSPKGIASALHLADGDMLKESLDIVQWVFDAHDPGGWWSRAQPDNNLALLRTSDGEFKHQLDCYKYPDRYPQEATPYKATHTRATKTLLMLLESRLLDQRYFSGLVPRATGLATLPFVRQFTAMELGWFARQPLPAIQAWLAGWFTSRLFEACMTRQPVQVVAVFPEYRHLDGSTDQLTD